MAEVVKYAAIADHSILDLCKNVHENIDEIIRRCVEIKKAIDSEDSIDHLFATEVEVKGVSK